jgi:polyisoprenoid-binding protein YceI
MSFTSTSCADGKLSGKLTIRGVSKDITFPARYSADAAGFRVEGSVELKHTDFGFQPYSAMMGAIRNGDRLTLKVDLRAKPAG